MKELFRNKQGRVVGWLKDRTYYKMVNSDKHLMHIYNAYGISEEIIQKLQGRCDRIRLKEYDTDRIYEVPFETFFGKGFVKQWDGKQRFLPLKFWQLDGPNLSLPLSESKAKPER